MLYTIFIMTFHVFIVEEMSYLSVEVRISGRMIVLKDTFIYFIYLNTKAKSRTFSNRARDPNLRVLQKIQILPERLKYAE